MAEKKGVTIEIVDNETFNKLFFPDLSLVVLPHNAFALGFHAETGKFCLYRSGLHADAGNNIRMKIVLDFWIAHVHSLCPAGKSYKFLFGVWDGWRERIAFSPGKELRTYRPLLEDFKGKVEIDSPSGFAPLLGKDTTLFAFCRHSNDQTVTLVPDDGFISTNGFKHFVDQVRIQKPWSERKAKFVWRGKLECGEPQNFTQFVPGQPPPRRSFMNLVKKFQAHEDSKTREFFSSHLDCENSWMNPSQMAEHKFIFDIDGYTSTYAATVWKMASGSVMVKQESHWEQWHYHNWKPWIHYVPVKNDFSNLREIMKWCLDHDKECEKIASNVKKHYNEHLSYEKGKEVFIAVRKDFFSRL